MFEPNAPIPLETHRAYGDILKAYPIYDDRLNQNNSSNKCIEVFIDTSSEAMHEHIMNYKIDGKTPQTPIAFLFNIALEELASRDMNKEYINIENLSDFDAKHDSFCRDHAKPTIQRLLWGVEFLAKAPPLTPWKTEYVIDVVGGLLDKNKGNELPQLVSSYPSNNNASTKDEFMKNLHNSIDSVDKLYITSTTVFHLCIQLLRAFGYSRLKLKKCQMCGRYFVEETFNEKYCKFGNRQHGGKSCADVARYLQNISNLNKQEYGRLEKQIYDRLAKRANIKGYSSDDYQLFMKFADEKKKKKYDLANSHISKNEYELWLQEWDNKSRKRPKKQRKD